MSPSLSPSLADLQARFVAIMPRIEVHGQIYFRHEKCPSTKDDCLAEMLALSWKWFIRLDEQGKDPTTFVSAIATYAARAVRSGRCLCGQEKTKDVLSPLGQQRRGFAVLKLPDYASFTSTPFTDALIDNTRTPPDEQAAFRIDFPNWITTLDDRRRRIAEAMMMNEQTRELASKFGVSSARISQMRREFHDDWEQFCDVQPAAAPPSGLPA